MSIRLVILACALIVLPATSLAQVSGDGAFDMSRFSVRWADSFEPFLVRETYSLQRLLFEGAVTEGTAVLVTETADGKLALLTDQLAYHHIAQGSERGEPWMVSF